MSGLRSLNHQRWLDAFTDPQAGIYTFSQCITLSNLNADGDYKLIVADLGTGSTNIKLKVFRGTSLMTELTLVDVPTALASLYIDLNEPRIPAIAVASGPNIYIYKNLRPYFKFCLPSLEVNPLEMDLWHEVRNKGMDVDILYEMLQNIRQEMGFSALTQRSQRLLTLEHHEWVNFVEEQKNLPLKKQTVITCMTTLKKSMSEEDAISCLVVGTENGDIYFLDSEAFTILEQVKLFDGPDILVPAHICSHGLFDVDFYMFVACRDGSLCNIKREWKEARKFVNLGMQVVGMVLLPDVKSIVVALTDETLQCYSKKGKKQWGIKLPCTIVTLGIVPLPHMGLNLICVALASGTVQFYSGRQLVDTITAPDTVSGIKFGHFGQEENTLILITVGGCLLVKILKRTAQFTDLSNNSSHVPSQHIKMTIPKKTKLFVEQTARERDNAISMHQTFQQDLLRLRLNTGRECVKALRSCSNPISSSTVEPLKIAAQVLGLGPVFKIQLSLQNMSESNPSKHLSIVFHSDDKIYSIDKPFIQVPMLVPGLTYQFETLVECISDIGISDQVRIFIVKENQTQPILAASITMPVCDILTVL